MKDLDVFDLDQDIEKIYTFMNNDTLNKKREEKKNLDKLRNNNHKRYYNINLVKFQYLPDDFSDLYDQIKKIYKEIIPKKILTETKEEAIETKKKLDEINRIIKRIERMIKTLIKTLEEETENAMKDFSIIDFNNLEIDDKSKRRTINLYNELVIYNSIDSEDIYNHLKQLLNKKKNIEDIKKYISLGKDKNLNVKKENITKKLNNELDKVIDETSNKIQYLSDLMIEDSNYEDSFNDFLGFYNRIIAYDDTNYDNVKQTLDILKSDEKFGNYVKNFESNLINEREEILNEEEFIYKKLGIRNIKIVLDYLSANYMDILDKPRKRVIEDTYNRINSINADIDIISKNLENIVKYIWQISLTGLKPTEDFSILCCKYNQEKNTEGYLLTKNILNRLDSYDDYKIGYICDFNGNILNITENDELDKIKYDDLSKLKTPKQIEQEFINYNIINKIILDDNKTKIIGIYFIDDNDNLKLEEATEISKKYNIPLIKLKKN